MKDVPNYRVYLDFDRDFSLNPVHIDDVKTSTRQNNWVIHPHRHDDLCHLIYFYSGTGQMHSGGKTYPLEVPCFFFIPAGDVHSFNVDKDIEGILVTVSRSYLEQLVADDSSCLDQLDNHLLIQGTLSGSPDFRRGLDQLFRKLRVEYTERQLGRNIAIRSILGQIFIEYVRLAGELEATPDDPLQDRNLWYYRRFQNLIGYSLADKKAVSEYAAELRISVTHLNRICQSIAGKSALKIIHDRILSEAKVNLAYTFQSVSEVAYRLGFDDISYFSRFFKSHVGISPREFKSRVRTVNE